MSLEVSEPCEKAEDRCEDSSDLPGERGALRSNGRPGDGKPQKFLDPAFLDVFVSVFFFFFCGGGGHDLQLQCLFCF